MATAMWSPDRWATIDSVSPTTNFGGFWNIGKVFAGGSKTLLRRQLLYIDLTTSPDSGTPIPVGATIDRVYLTFSGVARIGNPASGHTIYRQRRNDWVQAQATWNISKTANNWGTAGCGNTTTDIDTTTPAAVTFTGPSADGDFSIQGMEDFYDDAIANRSGIFNIRVTIDNETNDGVDRFWSVVTVSLVVEYTATERVTSGGREHRQPRIDPNLRLRPEGRALRVLREAERSLEEAVRGRVA